MIFAVEAKGRSESMSKEVEQIINTLCDKLGVAANILVPEMARYNIARLAFLTVVQGILSIVVAAIIVRLVKYCLTSENVDDEERTISVFLTNLIPGLVLVALVVCTISSATDLIGWIASPTASAVKEITSMIK